MSDIPPEIITAILIRLPVKSLLRSRCVSKPWLSLIDGQDFIKLHRRHSTETNSNRTLVVKSTNLFYVDLDSFQRLGTGNIRFNPRHVAGSCDGLVLLVSDANDVVLWNPSTRKVNQLPRSLDVHGRQGHYAFGYDSKHDDYKVVRLVPGSTGDSVQGGGCMGGCMCSKTMIYSLRSNSWKTVENFPYVLAPGKSWGVYLNGALHTGFEFDFGPGAVIMAFDLATEEHDAFTAPEFGGGIGGLASVEVIGGCLAAVFFGKKSSREIWVMKEYGVNESWCRLLQFVPLPCLDPIPLAYSKNGDEVLLNYGGICLNWYNLRKKSVTIACVEGLSSSFGAMEHETLFDVRLCVASLVSPYSPGGVGKNGEEFKKKKREDFLSVGFKLVL